MWNSVQNQHVFRTSGRFRKTFWLVLLPNNTKNTLIVHSQRQKENILAVIPSTETCPWSCKLYYSWGSDFKLQKWRRINKKKCSRLHQRTIGRVIKRSSEELASYWRLLQALFQTSCLFCWNSWIVQHFSVFQPYRHSYWFHHGEKFAGQNKRKEPLSWNKNSSSWLLIRHIDY